MRHSVVRLSQLHGKSLFINIPSEVYPVNKQLTPDVNSGHEIYFTLRPALHRTVAHRQPGIGTPAVLAVFADCRRPRCAR